MKHEVIIASLIAFSLIFPFAVYGDIETLPLWEDATANLGDHAEASLEINANHVLKGGTLTISAKNTDTIYYGVIEFRINGVGGPLGVYYLSPGQYGGAGKIPPGSTKSFAYSVSEVMVASSSAPSGYTFVNYTEVINDLHQSNTPITIEAWVNRNDSGCRVNASLTLELLQVIYPLEVSIDIKPGSETNAFKQDEHGVIPVAIHGSPELDVNLIKLDSLAFQGLSVKVAGKCDRYMTHIEDINYDGYNDLVVQFLDSDQWVTPGTGNAMLTGSLNDGTPIYGSDTISIL